MASLLVRTPHNRISAFDRDQSMSKEIRNLVDCSVDKVLQNFFLFDVMLHLYAISLFRLLLQQLQSDVANVCSK